MIIKPKIFLRAGNTEHRLDKNSRKGKMKSTCFKINNVYLRAFCSIFSSMSLKICLNSKSPGNEFNKQCRSKELWGYSSPQSILRNKNKKMSVSPKWKEKKKTQNPSRCNTNPIILILIYRQDTAVEEVGLFLI